MKRYRYSLSTTTIWTSFDCGEVEAENIEQAREKALIELKYNLRRANASLAYSDNTSGFTIEMNWDCLEVELITDNNP